MQRVSLLLAWKISTFADMDRLAYRRKWEVNKAKEVSTILILLIVQQAGSYSILRSSEYRDLKRGVESSLGHLGTVLGLLQLLLSLAELGQVEGGDLLGLLPMLLVGLDLALQLAGQVRHAVLVLPVLVTLELELLDLAVGLLVSLHVPC